MGAMVQHNAKGGAQKSGWKIWSWLGLFTVSFVACNIGRSHIPCRLQNVVTWEEETTLLLEHIRTHCSNTDLNVMGDVQWEAIANKKLDADYTIGLQKSESFHRWSSSYIGANFWAQILSKKASFEIVEKGRKG